MVQAKVLVLLMAVVLVVVLVGKMLETRERIKDRKHTVLKGVVPRSA